ncbi:AAA family ATPase [[Phormidium] sp. ETS-05]|uniref:AAA family ATPase n=1 Tax=[Phormidium] sp. ETS-05 TaxID=222819 RepID=UPI0018EEDD6A|nr:AAA family ATPase [[Phormidium] sp. ETS-05]
MNQKLTLKQFGPISDIQLDVKDIMIFIGSQASGKSTISKAVFFFKSLRDDLTGHLYQCYTQKQFDTSVANFAKRAKQKFIKMYGSVLQFPEMELKYEYGRGMEVTVRPSEDNRYTTIEFNLEFRQKFRELMEKAERLNDELQQRPLRFSSSREITAIKAKESAFFEELTFEVNQLFNDNRDILFLPAGRSLITTLSQQRYNIDMGDDWGSDSDWEADGLIKLDHLMQNFINRIDEAKRILLNQEIGYLIQSRIHANPEIEITVRLAQKLVESILKGSYRYQNGTDWIDFGDGKSTLINFASSGQQEVVWILQLIMLLILERRPVFLVIEEPEAHLFPVAQKQIIDLIALLANQGENQIFLTTHSPYILSSFNNLLYAQNLGMTKPESVSQVVERSLWIDADRLDAYILEQGQAVSIVDREMRLMESAKIDEASDVIIDTFNQLFELEDEA